MVTRHVGGEIVNGGIYWSMGRGEFIAVPREGGRLAGGQKESYVRAPLPIVLIVGPLMGLAFVIFLPLSGFLVLLSFLAGKIRAAATSRWAKPAVSYLGPLPHTGTREDLGSEADEGEMKDKLVDLATEITEKKWQQE